MNRKNLKRKLFNRCLTVTIFCIIAVTISIFYVALGQSAGTQNSQLVSSKPQQFNLQTAYAYVGKGPENDTTNNQAGNLLMPVSEYPSTIIFNITKPVIQDANCDAVLEVYKVRIATDKGLAENFIYFVGTNSNPAFSEEQLDTLTAGIYNLFDINTIDAVRGNFQFNWTGAESVLSAQVGSYGIYTDYIHGLGLWTEGQPNAISVSIHRLGNVETSNGAISVQPDATGIERQSVTQLAACNNAFLTNTIVPNDKLSQVNAFEPIK